MPDGDVPGYARGMDRTHGEDRKGRRLERGGLERPSPLCSEEVLEHGYRILDQQVWLEGFIRRLAAPGLDLVRQVAVTGTQPGEVL